VLEMAKVKLLKDRQVDGTVKKAGVVVSVSDHIARRWNRCGYSEPLNAEQKPKESFGQKIGLDRSEKK
jgi:hypothetical protein